MSEFSFLNLNVLPPNHGNGSHRLLLPLAPRPQYTMDLPFLNLNSSLENDMASIVVSQAMPPPATPATMEKNQSQRERVQHHPPLEIIDLEAETWSFQDLLRSECGQLLQSLADNPVEQGFSNQVESSQVASSQYQEGERSVAVNVYEGHAVQQAEGENQGIDLNKTPLQKPKRKKHRPKVIREGKLTRTPKPATPKPPKTTENRLGKRKYVRKKKDASPQETPTNPRESPSSAGVGEVVDLDRQSRNKSVRRSLNFDLEDSQVVDRLSGSASMMCRQNVLESQGQEAHTSPENGSSWTTSAAHCSQRQGPVALDGLTGCAAGFDLNSSQNQFGNENTVRIPQTPMQPPQPSRQVMMAIKWQQDFDRMLNNMDTSLQSVRKDGENLKELARTMHGQNISGNLARFLEDRQSRIASSRNSEMLLQGEKRGNSLVFHTQVPANMNFTQANNRSAIVNGVCDASSSDQCYSDIHKRRRTENGQKEPMLNASSISSSTPKGLITGHTLRNMREVRTFADAQRYMTLEKQSSKHVLELNQEAGASDGRIQDHGLISTPSKPFVHNKMDCMQPPTPEKVPEYRNGQETLGCGRQAQAPTPEKVPEYRNGRETLGCGPQPRVEVLVAKQKAKARSWGKKEHEPLINSMAGNAKQSVNVSAASQIGYYPTTESAPQKSRMKTAQQGSSPPQDTHDGNSYEAAACSGFQSRELVSYKDPMDEIVWRLRHLDINSAHEDITIQPQNALIPYAGAGGAMVPFEGLFDLIKKRKPRPKVDLDPESHRVWKLLMGKESNEGEEGTDVDKEKWWEEERRVFRGRADSFIARMHLIQGDRRFSKWKGSVVDSVIGVFLTQNVSDHLSSSAFMCLAARFPPQSKGKTKADKLGTISRLMVGNDTTRKGETSDPESCALSSLGINESEQRSNKEMVNSNESLESNSEGGIIDYLKESTLEFHEMELGIGQESPDSTLGTTVTVTSCTSAVEGDDRKSLEDVVSSQNSVASSQNTSECPSQTTDQSQPSPLLNFEADELRNGGRSNCFCTFTELLEMADGRVLNDLKATGNGRILSTEHSGMIDWSAALQIDRSPSIPNGAAYLNGAGTSIYSSNSHLHSAQHDFSTLSYASSSYCHQNFSTSTFVGMAKANVTINETSQSYVPTSTFGLKGTNINETASRLYGSCTGSSTNATDQNAFLISKIPPPVDSFGQLNRNPDQLVSCSGTGVRPLHSERHSCCQSEASSKKNVSPTCLNLKDGSTLSFQQREKDIELQMEMIRKGVKTHTEAQNDGTPNTCPALHYNDQRNKNITGGRAEANLRKEADISEKLSAETSNNAPKGKKVKTETEKKTFDWDSLRRQVCPNNAKKERSRDTIDSLDYEAVRNADVNEIAHTIRERGMNNMLAERIKDFLNRLVRDHGSIDLEWLRDIPPDKAKDYLLSVRGLGLKSVECVRLLTLHHLAFPVDTNVGRICVRLGWVPLQPLPESLQLHLLEMYPILETIQKYLWPRLCTLDQRTLYELHYQLITFGKVFCTKSKPNCNACPMRGECKHFASAFASARLALPGPEEKRLMSSEVPLSSERSHNLVSNPMPLPLPEGSTISKEQSVLRNCEPIIEEPATPEPECIETSEIDIEDAFYNDPDEIPTIRLNFEEFAQNLQNYMEENNMGLQDGDMSKALVAISPEVASIPTPKLKNVSRLRTEHQVYELPDSHPLLEGLDKRETDDPCPYLLAIWTPGETAQSTEPPTVCCNSQDTGKLCDKNTCFSCNSIREAQAQTVRGTLLIPCRTANRGSFPLNGTYFQVNEVFADHDSSCNPIDVPRDWIWNLPRRTVYFGTSIPSIFKGLTTEGIQHCFWRGFVCVRGFDRTSRAPRPLFARLHFPASKVTRNKKTAGATAREEK